MTKITASIKSKSSSLAGVKSASSSSKLATSASGKIANNSGNSGAFQKAPLQQVSHEGLDM